MTQVTVVALYGPKSDELGGLIAECQALVGRQRGVSVAPYPLPQVHATLIGLERRAGSRLDNANFATYQGQHSAMDLNGFLNHLRTCHHFPMRVQLGGFAKEDGLFTSRGALPFERSFSLQGEKVVMIGWPVRASLREAESSVAPTSAVRSGPYPGSLEALRREAQAFGVLHGYHRGPGDVDNDLFFRIGMTARSECPGTEAEAEAEAEAAAAGDIESRVREFLSRRGPVMIEIGLQEVFIAAYRDDRLPLDSTRTWSLTDPLLTGELVESLIDESV